MISAAVVAVAWSLRPAGPSSAIVAGNLRRGFEADGLSDAGSAPRDPGSLVAALARRSRRITPAGMLERLDALVTAADATWSMEQVLAAKLLLGGVVGVLSVLWFVGGPSLLVLLIGGFVTFACWYLPDILLGQRATKRRESLARGLPDAMDQLMITVESGLGFEAALARVAASGDGVIHGELRRTTQDVQIGVPRGEALDRLAQRTDLPELRQFVTAVRQAERYGLPIANVLRLQSAELREKRRQVAEERAMKIPVKVLFPLLFCILPALFIVVIGPGVIRMVSAFGG